MDNAALLSPTDITVIRRYVHTKYAPLPIDRRAEIVADAVRRTLLQRLPKLPMALTDRLTDELIARCLVSERRDVKPDDVLDLFAELAGDDAEGQELPLDSIVDWANERAPGRWSPEQLASRLERRKAYPLVLVPTAVDSIVMERPTWWDSDARWRKYVPRPAWGLFAAVVVCAATAGILFMDKPAAHTSQDITSPPPQVASVAPAVKRDVGMPERLKYEEIDVEALKKFLKSRNSLLADAPYFKAIVDSARKYDVNPLLLFAITGQEQGFVPRTGKNAKLIANNPFNVGHSWMEYNTTIGKSASIAAEFIAQMGLDRPEGHEPFEWFNQLYAEDDNWANGVRAIFEQLRSLPPSS
jgi:hypothetical protein